MRQRKPANSQYAPAMRWIWLLCIVLLAVRMGGAHLHLCFDGMEPPLAIHAGDIAGHDQPGYEHADTQHVDTDLSLVDDGVAKTIQLTLLPALLAALLVLCLREIIRSTPASTYSPPLFRFIPSRFSAPRAPPR
jgi:hypothetical protein